MSVRTLCVIIVAVVVGLLATVSASRLGSFGASSRSVAVAAAEEDLFNFEVITLDLLEPAEIPVTAYREDQHFLWPDSGTMSSKQYEKTLRELSDRVCGRSVVYALNRGELLLGWHLAGEGTGRGLAELIPTGMRAATIDLSETGGIPSGYFVRPGDYVDLIGRSGSKSDGPNSAKAILESVEVLGVDQRPERITPGRRPLGGPSDDDGKPQYKEPILRSVTVLLKANDVETLESYRAAGTLTLSFRNFEDRGSPAPATSTENE